MSDGKDALLKECEGENVRTNTRNRSRHRRCRVGNYYISTRVTGEPRSPFFFIFLFLLVLSCCVIKPVHSISRVLFTPGGR